MKKLLILFVAMMVALSMLAGCGGTSSASTPADSSASEPAESSEPEESSEPDESSEPETDAPAAIDGFAVFESSANKIQFQYPADWQEMNPERLNDPELLAAMEAELNLTGDEIEQMLSAATAMFFDTENSTNDFAANFNLVASPSPGATQEILKGAGVLEELKTSVDAQYNSMFPGFSWVQEPELKTAGDNTFVVMQVKYNLSGIDVIAYQAMTFGADMTYAFTYSGLTVEANTISAIESILSTVVIG